MSYYAISFAKIFHAIPKHNINIILFEILDLHYHECIYLSVISWYKITCFESCHKNEIFAWKGQWKSLNEERNLRIVLGLGFHCVIIMSALLQFTKVGNLINSILFWEPWKPRSLHFEARQNSSARFISWRAETDFNYRFWGDLFVCALMYHSIFKQFRPPWGGLVGVSRARLWSTYRFLRTAQGVYI
jgi:hypothetical protein